MLSFLLLKSDQSTHNMIWKRHLIMNRYYKQKSLLQINHRERCDVFSVAKGIGETFLRIIRKKFVFVLTFENFPDK